MTTLMQLIEARRDGSYEKFARRANLPTASVYKYAKGKNSDFPTPETITRLATALGVSPAVVVAAAAEGLGIDMTDLTGGASLARTLPEGVDDLPQHVQQAIWTTAQAFVTCLRDQANDASTTELAGSLDQIAQAARRRIDQAVPPSDPAG